MRCYRLDRGNRLAVASAIILSLLATWNGQVASAAETPALRRALLATVLINVPMDGNFGESSQGTGSILTPDGYILTDYHVMADPDSNWKPYNKGGMAMIAVNDPADLGSLPIYTYQAQLVQFDTTLDQAVLKIVAPIDNEGSLPANLNLVTMPIGDSSQVDFNDTIECLGYPGVAGFSVTLSRGIIAGFLQVGPGGPQWIKTDAAINHGNSGGACVNDQDQMIGVADLILGYGIEGGIGSQDAGGGQFYGLRPINLDAALIAAATGSVSSHAPAPQATPAAPPASPTPVASAAFGPRASSMPGDPPATPAASLNPAAGPGAAAAGPQITHLVFSDSVDGNGNPGRIADRFDPGIKAVYALFAYTAFQNGAAFAFAWQRDGRPPDTNTITWDTGPQGSYWVNTVNDNGLAEGTYTLTLSLAGQALATGNMLIGAPVTPTQTARFSPPVFAEDVSPSQQPIRVHAAGQPFAQGTAKVFAFMDYSGIPAGSLVSFSWSVGGQAVSSSTQRWDASFPPAGPYDTWVSSGTALPAGHWRLDVQVDGTDATSGAFDVGGSGGAPTPAQPTGAGVAVMGTISDADTGRPIPAAFVWALRPGTDLDTFLNHPDAGMVYATGTADHEGLYNLSQPLQTRRSVHLDHRRRWLRERPPARPACRPGRAGHPGG